MNRRCSVLGSGNLIAWIHHSQEKEVGSRWGSPSSASYRETFSSQLLPVQSSEAQRAVSYLATTHNSVLAECHNPLQYQMMTKDTFLNHIHPWDEHSTSQCFCLSNNNAFIAFKFLSRNFPKWVIIQYYQWVALANGPFLWCLLPPPPFPLQL